jgi:hypothetical protein
VRDPRAAIIPLFSRLPAPARFASIPPASAPEPLLEDSNMKRFTLAALSLGLLITALPALAHEGHEMAMGKKATTRTIRGEVVDTGCYLGHAAKGEKHIACATKCINQGMPMGLLTSEGALYLLTMDHDNPDPYNQIKEMAGKTVAVTGEVMERSGMKGIDVTAFKAVTAVASK